jgi:hypothetical protein
MPMRRRSTLETHHACAPPPGLDAVWRHWQALRRGRPVPARSDLDPGPLRPWLTHSGIVACGAKGHVRFRLGGTALAALMGVEPRGMPLRALFAPDARGPLQDAFQTAFTRPCALLLSAVAPPARGGDGPAAVDMMLLPLTDAGGAVTRALFCLHHEATDVIALPCRLRPCAARPLGPPPPQRCAGVAIRRAGGPDLRIVAGGREA